jgi:hypothetical protein
MTSSLSSRIDRSCRSLIAAPAGEINFGCPVSSRSSSCTNRAAAAAS